MNKSDIHSDYRSVQDQTRLEAGDAGFNIQVQGNTSLTGAAITSTESAVLAGKNQFNIASLKTQDLHNSASASAQSRGLNLSQDTLSQGKYGVGKAVLGNALGNSGRKQNAASTTQSVIQQAQINITNPEAQRQRTGQTPAQTIASLNTKPNKAQQPLQKFDAQALGKRVEAERVIKDMITAEAFKLSDEAYRKIFQTQAFIIEVGLDPSKEQVQLRYLSALEKQNLKPAEDGKIHIATNGIFNDEEAAAKYALQHSTVQGPQYLVYFPGANNFVSELMVAAYQKYLENDALGLDTATQEIKRLSSQYGQQGLHLDGHSRGSMSIGNFLETQVKVEQSKNQKAKTEQGKAEPAGSLSKTTIGFFGPAYNAEKADGLLSQLQNREVMDTIEQKMESVLKMQNHAADPVGILIGKNPATGGTIPETTVAFREMLRAAMGKENTTHNCYGEGKDPCRKFWDASPNKIPTMAPIKNSVTPKSRKIN